VISKIASSVDVSHEGRCRLEQPQTRRESRSRFPCLRGSETHDDARCTALRLFGSLNRATPQDTRAFLHASYVRQLCPVWNSAVVVIPSRYFMIALNSTSILVSERTRGTQCQVPPPRLIDRDLPSILVLLYRYSCSSSYSTFRIQALGAYCYLFHCVSQKHHNIYSPVQSPISKPPLRHKA